METEENKVEEKNVRNKDNRWLAKGPIWILIAIIGPLALPFLFLSPHFSKGSKVGISLGLLLFALLFSLLGNVAVEMATQLP